MRKDISQAIGRLQKIAADGRRKMAKNLTMAIRDFPPEGQIRQLREIANDMNRIHKAMMRLAAARDSKGFRPNIATLTLSPRAMREKCLGSLDFDSRRLRKSWSRCS